MNNKQTILVTGATGNIGKGAALELVKRGAQVVLLGRFQDKLDAEKERFRIAFSNNKIALQDSDVATLMIDFSDMESVKQAANEALNRFPMIHGLILSAVTLVQHGPTILPNGHEVMFATNVMGPFLFTNLLLERIQQSNGLVLQIIAPFYKEVDWDDLESIKNHKTGTAYDRTKTCERAFVAELARRYEGKICSVAFNPTFGLKFIIDKSDPELKKRWPTGFLGLFWRMMAVVFAQPPEVAGKPIADLMLSNRDRQTINGALFNLKGRVNKPDKAMNNEVFGKGLWNELEQLTELSSE